ncbi:MAG: SDR family oxidoreductase [Planctomycetota bacterium]
MDSRLHDLVALVTGASGGIGWAIAEALALEGCRLALVGRSQAADLEQRVAHAGLSHRAIALAADVRDPATIEAAFGRAAERFGGIDVCVACAGIWPPESRRLHEMEVTRIREVVDVNLLGALYTARAFFCQLALKPRSGTSLLFVGSTAGEFGEAGHAEYAMTKAGLRGLMLSCKNEIVTLDPRGRCNLVQPGWTVTPMAAESLRDGAGVRRVLQTTPLRRIATVEDVASAVVFLSSPALSGHLTGQTLTVAGGMEGRVLWSDEEIDPDVARRT